MPFFSLLCRFRFLTLAVLPFTLIAENLREVGNMLLGKRKRAIPRWVAGAVFLICILAMMLFLASEVTPRRDQLRLEARINGGEMALDEGYDYGGALTLTAVLPEWESRWYPLLEIRYADEAEVFLDGEIIGRMEEWDRKMLGNAVFMLPQGCAGKTVTLATTKEEGEPLPFLYITDSGIMRETVRADTAKSALPAAVFAVVSLLALGLFFYGLTEGNCAWPVLMLGFAALSQMLYFHAESRGGYILPPKLYGLGLSLSRAVLFALPPFCWLLYMKKWRKLFMPFTVLPALAYFVVAGFQTVVPAFSMIASRMGEVFYFTAAALVACAILEYRDGNQIFRLFLPGLALSAAGIGAACLLSDLCGGGLFLYMQWLIGEINRRQPDQPLYWWSTFLLLLCLLASVLSQLHYMAARETQIQVLSARESMAKEQLAVVQESDESLRRMRHETVNHYTVLQKLSQAGAWDRLEKYLAGLLADVEAVPAMAYVAHPAINAVLTIMLARAQKLGIKAEYEVSAPEILPFPDTELCTVLMNLLQNALDANALAPEGEKKWLRVSIHIRGAHLYIGVENPRFGPVKYNEETGLCHTTKEDRTIHGYGLKAVQAVAQKYQSELLLEFPDGLFSAATALQMPEER